MKKLFINEHVTMPLLAHIEFKHNDINKHL